MVASEINSPTMPDDLRHSITRVLCVVAGQTITRLRIVHGQARTTAACTYVLPHRSRQRFCERQNRGDQTGTPSAETQASRYSSRAERHALSQPLHFTVRRGRCGLYRHEADSWLLTPVDVVFQNGMLLGPAGICCAACVPSKMHSAGTPLGS